ncbi:MAG TPA: type II toxin-antitoxin system RelE/ParE family toxin [Ktedonobacteraceae bacterium]|nr:type II toxin-antitoxin system RelE/ParE family toxin [Ktedonobacteraceae bacterium]
MSYRILITKQVEKQLNALPQKVATRVDEHIKALREEPRPFGVKKLRGYTDSYRVRVGNHRIIYTIDDRAQTITLLTVDDRKDVYR